MISKNPEKRVEVNQSRNQGPTLLEPNGASAVSQRRSRSIRMGHKLYSLQISITNDWYTHREGAGTKSDNRILKWRNSPFAIVSLVTPFQIPLTRL